MFAEFACDHQMAFYGGSSPRLIALVNKIGVDAKWFTILQALEPAGAHRAEAGGHRAEPT